jgi:mono/diheme cytochrome c family protein
MPAFNMLPEADLDAMVSYVIHLSIRGETEFNTIQTILSGGEIIEDSIAKHVYTWQRRYLVDRWAASDKSLLKPSSTPTYTPEQLEKSILNGYKLFTDTQGAASCINCHIDFGRQVPFRYDDWGTLVRPLNLTVATYRGGRRPIDLFWRVKGGINPSGMPAAGSLTDDNIWDVVNFLQALPYPKMLPAEIRDKIYVPLTQVAAH